MYHPKDNERLTWYLDEIGKIDLIDREKEAKLAQRIRDGDTRALQELARANLRFVVFVAKRYQGQGLSLPDLIAQGNYGLMKAAKRFDETQGNRFITYAVWWIRQTILKALSEHTKQVRLPSNRTQLILKINRVSRELLQVYGREPTVTELADKLEIDHRYVYEAHLHTQQYLQLKEPYDEDGMRLCDIISSGCEAPTSKLLKESLKVDIERVSSLLHAREAEIVRLYYGIYSEHPLTLAEIGKRLDLTRERVRQIKEKALRKLRQPNRRKYLQSYATPVANEYWNSVSNLMSSIASQLSLKTNAPSQEELEVAHRTYLRARFRTSSTKVEKTENPSAASGDPDSQSSLSELMMDFEKRTSKSEFNAILNTLSE